MTYIKQSLSFITLIVIMNQAKKTSVLETLQYVPLTKKYKISSFNLCFIHNVCTIFYFCLLLLKSVLKCCLKYSMT